MGSSHIQPAWESNNNNKKIGRGGGQGGGTAAPVSLRTPENTVKNFDGKLFSVSADSMKTLTADLKAFPDTITAFSFGDSVHLRIRDNDGSIDHLRHYLSNYKNLVISEIQPTIEDCFMAKI